MVKPRDSGRKNEFITSRRIPIYIYEGQNKIRREVNRNVL